MTEFESTPVIGNRLGRGAFGTVFEGTCPVHRDVAVKIISKSPVQSDDEWNAYKTRLIREASLLAAARHANVVPVHYVYPSAHRDEVCMVMQRCEASVESLYEAGPMSLENVRKVGTDVAQGLMALHEREMIHRDIKPGNILANRGTYLLSDFGLVTDEMVFGYASMGDYNYADHIAKEVWETRQTSPRTDIWALGMTLYRLLHGKSWYDDWHSLRVAPQVERGGFAAKLRWLPHVPDEWRRLVRKALHDDPGLRFQSCDQLLNALAKLPIEPSWSCVVDDAAVTWGLERKGRRLAVVWNRSEARTNSWSARSDPLDAGRTRSLGQSAGPLSTNAVLAELDSWFKSFR